MQKKRLWLLRLALLAFSTFLGLGSIEVLLRAIDRDEPLLWEPDPKLGWRHVPKAQVHWREEGDGLVAINSLGFRDAERTVAKEEGVFRIAVFGDSTTEAVQVNLDETFCQLLEAKLRQRGMRAEVLNFGVSGYGALQAYLLYSQRGREFDPDLVLHAVFLDNDVADGDRRLAPGQRGAPFLESSAEGEFEIDYSDSVRSAAEYRREPVHTIRRLSAIYRVLRATQNRNNLASLQASGDPAGQVPNRFLLYSEPLAGEWAGAWRTFERVVNRFSETVKRDGATFAVVSVPAGQVVDREVWEQLLTEHPAMSARKWDVFSAERRLRQIAERYSIPLIAPLETFVRERSAEPLFFDRIGHLTTRGHEAMAGALEDGLAKAQLVRISPSMPTY